MKFRQHLQRKKITLIFPNGRSMPLTLVSKKNKIKLLTNLKDKSAWRQHILTHKNLGFNDIFLV
jgi:hypothetical protein